MFQHDVERITFMLKNELMPQKTKLKMKSLHVRDNIRNFAMSLQGGT